MKKILFVLSVLCSISAAAQSVLVVPNVDSFFQAGKWYYKLPAATTSIPGLATPQQIQDLNKAKSDIITIQANQATEGAPKSLAPIVYAGTAFIATDTAQNRVIVCTSNNAVSFTIPAGLKPGFYCRITQAGNGTITFKPGTGATLYNRMKYFRSNAINADIDFYNTLPNTYNLCGNLK